MHENYPGLAAAFEAPMGNMVDRYVTGMESRPGRKDVLTSIIAMVADNWARWDTNASKI